MTVRLSHLTLILVALWADVALATSNTGIFIAEPPPVSDRTETIPTAETSPASDAAQPPSPEEAANAETEETAAEPEEDTKPEPNTIILQGLNKVTGHISKLEAPVGTVMRFGNLEIIGRRCWKSRPDEQPENAGLLEIWELKPGESHQRIFLGWIFSSSPGLSGLEHPVYDVTMLNCEFLSDPERLDEKDKEPQADKKEPSKEKAQDKDSKPSTSKGKKSGQ